MKNKKYFSLIFGRKMNFQICCVVDNTLTSAMSAFAELEASWKDSQKEQVVVNNIFKDFIEEHGEINLWKSFDHIVDCMKSEHCGSVGLCAIPVFFCPEESDAANDAVFNSCWKGLIDYGIHPVLVRDDWSWEIGCNFDGVLKLWTMKQKEEEKNQALKQKTEETTEEGKPKYGDFWVELTKIFGEESANLLRDRVSPDFFEKRMKSNGVTLLEVKVYAIDMMKNSEQVPQCIIDKIEQLTMELTQNDPYNSKYAEIIVGGVGCKGHRISTYHCGAKCHDCGWGGCGCTSCHCCCPAEEASDEETEAGKKQDGDDHEQELDDLEQCMMWVGPTHMLRDRLRRFYFSRFSDVRESARELAAKEGFEYD